MQKVLFAANQFPPEGGSGVQRSVKFVKHLRSFGYEPVVFTRDIKNLSLTDETLLKDIPDGTEIIRSKAFDFTGLKKPFTIFGKVLALKILIPDSARIWAEMGKKKALNIIKKQNIKLLYTTSAPYSGHLLGLYIKKKLPDVIWAADFRDEWTNNPYLLDNPHNFIRMKIEKKMEKAVLEKADILITNTPIMRENFIRNNNIKGDNFYVIPNGYDIDDFKNIKIENTHNEKFTLTYTGALYGRRKPDTFFKAVSELINENKIDGSKIKIQFIGNYYIQKLKKHAQSFGLDKQIEILGYMPHDECVKKQLLSDALVLIEGAGKGSEAFYTGKLFEYMATKKPVAAIIPEKGSAAELVKKTKIGFVSDTNNVLSIKQNLLDYYNSWLKGQLLINPDEEVIKAYERKELTKQLAGLFDQYLNKKHETYIYK